MSTSLRILIALKVISSRLPIGVATTKSVPAVFIDLDKVIISQPDVLLLVYYGNSIRIYQPNRMNFKFSLSTGKLPTASLFVVSVFLTGCVQEGTTVQVDSSLPSDSGTIIADAPPTTPSADEIPAIIEFPSEDSFVEVVVPETEYSAWNLVNQAESSEPSRNLKLIDAANVLLREHNISQALSVAGLLVVDELSDSERVDYDVFRARVHQFNARHNVAYRQLGRISKRPILSPEQTLRIARLRVHSASHLDDKLLLVNELVRLYAMLPAGDERLTTGHQLWQVLSMVPSDELAMALSDSDLANAHPWILLALNINLVRHDPHLMRNALDNWIASNPDHQAVQLIESGIASDNLTYSNIAVLLPLSSHSNLAVRTFMDGINAQYFADTSPNKPILEFVDIGNDPSQITQHYFQALFDGAEFVVGPLGVSYVEEMVRSGTFVVPTLLLGVADDIPQSEPVYQFALAPEHDGVIAAQRARQDGHKTALILESPSNWSKRATDAFRLEWERLGGAVIQSKIFETGRNDYSDTVKEVFNIAESVQRYRTLRDELGRSLKFIPRRRQDMDCIFLSSDPLHGRLIKPHIDFLKAHDIPVYATSRIYSGEIDKISDQDLDGIRFADMSWLVDQGDTTNNLRRKLKSERQLPVGLNRIYAMGIDTYNLVSRLDTLRENSTAKYHGITSTMTVDEMGRVVRHPMWAKFADGTPEPILHLPDPERMIRPVNREPDATLMDLQR